MANKLGAPTQTESVGYRLEPMTPRNMTSSFSKREKMRRWPLSRRKSRSTSFLRLYISRLSDPVLITEAEPFDHPGPRILFVNEAFGRQTGYSLHEVVGRSPRILQGLKSDPVEIRRLGAALRRWEAVRCELVNDTKDGQEVRVEMDIVPIADATGYFTHRVSIQRDVTARKRNEASPGRPVPRPAAFDVVVTDLDMPELSGPQFAAAVADIRVDLPVVLGSGFVGDELTGIAASAASPRCFGKKKPPSARAACCKTCLPPRSGRWRLEAASPRCRRAAGGLDWRHRISWQHRDVCPRYWPGSRVDSRNWSQTLRPVCVTCKVPPFHSSQ